MSDYGSCDLWAVVVRKRAQSSEETIITHGSGTMVTELRNYESYAGTAVDIVESYEIDSGTEPEVKTGKVNYDPGRRK